MPSFQTAQLPLNCCLCFSYWKHLNDSGDERNNSHKHAGFYIPSRNGWQRKLCADYCFCQGVASGPRVRKEIIQYSKTEEERWIGLSQRYNLLSFLLNPIKMQGLFWNTTMTNVINHEKILKPVSGSAKALKQIAPSLTPLWCSVQSKTTELKPLK